MDIDLPIKIKLPDGFLEPEVRCDYQVTKELKELWAVELDLLSEFDRVCKKYHLQYVATGGTLLGAVRHKGFIPWDDDIDLGMKRSDYKRLCDIASEEFKQPYFFQTEYTDPTSFRGHAQLRNSYTTAILSSENERMFNQGVFIDIFPLDNVTDDKELLSKQIKKINHLNYRAKKILLYSNYYEYEKPERVTLKYRIKKFIRYITVHFTNQLRRISDYYYACFERECQKYNHKRTTYMSMLSFMPDNTKLYIESKDFEASIVTVKFEFLNIPILNYYDTLLTRQYGDWKRPKKVPSYHGDVFFNVRMPYVEYLKKR